MENAERAGSGKKRFHHWEFVAFYLLVYDILAVNIAYFVALWLRFDLKYSMIPADYMAAFIKFAPIYTVFSILVFFVLRLYRSLWRFAVHYLMIKNKRWIIKFIHRLFFIINFSR